MLWVLVVMYVFVDWVCRTGAGVVRAAIAPALLAPGLPHSPLRLVVAVVQHTQLKQHPTSAPRVPLNRTSIFAWLPLCSMAASTLSKRD